MCPGIQRHLPPHEVVEQDTQVAQIRGALATAGGIERQALFTPSDTI